MSGRQFVPLFENFLEKIRGVAGIEGRIYLFFAENRIKTRYAPCGIHVIRAVKQGAEKEDCNEIHSFLRKQYRNQVFFRLMFDDESRSAWSEGVKRGQK